MIQCQIKLKAVHGGRLMAASSSSNNSSSASAGTPQDDSQPRQPIATGGDLVKCGADGELDWDTLGKVVTASVLGETLLISHADFKYGQMTRGGNLDIGWKFSYEDKGVLVLRKEVVSTTEGSIICFAGRGVLNYPVEYVAEVVMNTDNISNWNKFLVESRVVRTLRTSGQSRDTLLYLLHENKKCFVKAKRDFFVYSHSTKRENGKFVNSGISIEHASCPPVRGTIRGKICLGSGWVLEPYEENPEKTLATYITNIDLCTPLSPALTTQMLESQPLTVYYLKKFLKSLNHVHQGVPQTQRACRRRSSGFETDLETSITSTVHDTESFFLVDSQRSMLYREQMTVDHFMGPAGSLKKLTEDDYSSPNTSRSNSQARSSGVLSQDSC